MKSNLSNNIINKMVTGESQNKKVEQNGNGFMRMHSNKKRFVFRFL